MHFTARAGDVAAALRFAAAATPVKTTIPILNTVLVRADTDGSVTAHATDLDLDATASFTAEVAEPGALAVDSRTAVLVAGLPPDADVTIAISATGATATVRCGRSTYRPSILPPGDFPLPLSAQFDDPENTEPPCGFSMPATETLALFDRVHFAISTETTRYYLNGLYLHQHPHQLAAIGTDGAWLSRMTLPLPALDNAWPAAEIIIPRTAISRFTKLVKATDDIVRFRLSDTRIEVSAGNRKITSKYIVGHFPDYQRILPRSFTASANLDIADTIAALDRLDALVERKEDHVAGFAWDAGDATVALSLPRSHEDAADDALDATTTGAAAFAFSIDRMLAMLRQLSGDTARVEISEHHGPIVVLDPGDPQYYSLVMPISARVRARRAA